MNLKISKKKIFVATHSDSVTRSDLLFVYKQVKTQRYRDHWSAYISIQKRWNGDNIQRLAIISMQYSVLKYYKLKIGRCNFLIWHCIDIYADSRVTTEILSGLRPNLKNLSRGSNIVNVSRDLSPPSNNTSFWRIWVISNFKRHVVHRICRSYRNHVLQAKIAMSNLLLYPWSLETSIWLKLWCITSNFWKVFNFVNVSKLFFRSTTFARHYCWETTNENMQVK